MSQATTMEELLIYGTPEFTAIRQRVPIPVPGPNEVLIKVHSTGLNPKDWKYTQQLTSASALNIGDDIAGTIASVGSAVFEYAPGDRVAAFHQLGEPGGGYAEYAIALAATTFRLPRNVSFEEGATLPLAVMTAAIALFQALEMPLPSSPAAARGESKTPLLIYGGSTAVGAYALQLLKLSRPGPIIVVAGKGIDFVKSFGVASQIIDYRAGNVVAATITAVEAASPGKKLHHVLDCVSDFDSHKSISEILAAFGGGEINMLDPSAERNSNWEWPEGVKFSMTYVGSAYGQQHPWITEERAAADADFSYWFYRYMTKLLAEGKLKPHPFRILPQGLDGILQGVKDLKNNKVSAEKLVARIEETPGI